MKRVAAIPLVLLLLAACATSGGNVVNAYAKQLQSAVAVYEETMIAAGSAAEAGLITEDQLETIAQAGRLAQAGLETARASLAAYAASGEGDPWLMIEQAQEAMLALLRAATEAGVNK